MLTLLWRAKVGQILNSGKITFCFIVLPCEIVSALFLVLSADIFYITNVPVKAFLLYLGHHVLDSGCSLISSNAEPKEQQANAEWLLELILTESLRLVVARAWVCDWWLPGPESVIGGCQGLSLWLVVARAWVCDWWLPGPESVIGGCQGLRSGGNGETLVKGNDYQWVSLVAQRLKRLPTMRETCVRSLRWENPLENPMDRGTYRLLCPNGFPSKNTGEGCHFLLQGVFLIYRWHLCLLHWQVNSFTTETPGEPINVITPLPKKC